MSVATQLPPLQDIEVFSGADSSVTIALGVNVTGLAVSAAAYSADDSLAIPLSVTNATSGTVSLSFTGSLAGQLLGGFSSYAVVTAGASAVDPPVAVRTVRWGRIRVVTSDTISEDSPLYQAVEMVAGDEYTFSVDLGSSLAGWGGVFASMKVADDSTESLIASITSAGLGIVSVTIDETSSNMAIAGGASWRLNGISPSGSSVLLRAGPLRCYPRSRPRVQSSVGEGVVTVTPPSPSQLGSVFL